MIKSGTHDEYLALAREHVMRSVFIPVAIGCVAASLLVSVPSAAGTLDMLSGRKKLRRA